jgi:hypothetical protein
MTMRDIGIEEMTEEQEDAILVEMALERLALNEDSTPLEETPLADPV